MDTQREAFQQTAIDCGFKYWRAPDAHGVTATKAQAIDFIAQLVGVEVDIDDALTDHERIELYELREALDEKLDAAPLTRVAATVALTDAEYELAFDNLTRRWNVFGTEKKTAKLFWLEARALITAPQGNQSTSSRAIAQEERACRAEDVLIDLVNQIRKTNSVDDNGHDMKMNMAFIKAVQLLDSLNASTADDSKTLPRASDTAKDLTRELLDTLQITVQHFTKTPSTLADSQMRGKAHAVIAKAYAAIGYEAAQPVADDTEVKS